MTHVTCRLTAKNRDQPRNRTLGNRVWATFIFLPCTCLFASCAVWAAAWTGIAEHADVVVSTSLFPLFTALLIIFIILFCMLCVELAAYRRSVYWHCPRGVRSRVYETVRCPSVVSARLSVPAWGHSSKPAAAGLLLPSRRGGDIDRLLQQRRAVGECGQCHVVSVRR